MSNEVINRLLAVHLSQLELPTAYINAPFEPTEAPYLAESYLPATQAPVGMENGSTDEFTGIYQVTVSAPRKEYKLKGFELADLVSRHFVRGTKLRASILPDWFEYFTDKNFVAVRIERVEQNPGFIVGSRWNIPLSIQYRSFIKHVV